MMIWDYPEFKESAQLDGEESFSLSLFPNPATTTITLTLPVSKPSTITIINTLGVEVMSHSIAAHPNPVSLNIASLLAGAYFVVVRSEGEVFTVKFVKE